jgi:hypothetical protein
VPTKTRQLLLEGIRARDADVKALVKDFEAALRAALKKNLGKALSGDLGPTQAIAMLGRMYEQLEAAGLTDKLERIKELYGRELKTAKKVLEAAGKENVFAGVSLDDVQALIDLDVSAIKSRVFASTDKLRSAVARNILAGDPTAFPTLYDGLVGNLTGALETELNTATSAFYQTVINRQAGALGLDLWVYEGPEDDITRPFCQDLIDGGRVYTSEEIAGMANGQDLPVETYGGGYNCRHQWSPISEADAKEFYGYEP